MLLKPSLLLGAAALLPAHLLAQSQAAQIAEPVAIELRKEALVGRARVVLADIALIGGAPSTAAALGAIQLGSAPRVGYVEKLTRAQIEHAVRRHVATPALSWSGADSVALRSQARLVPAALIGEGAITAVQAHFAGRGRSVTLSLASPLKDLEVPVGELTVRPRAVSAKVQGGRLAQWVDLVVDGVVYRSVVVQVAVSAPQQAYLARHALPAGSMAGPADFEPGEIDLADADVLPATTPLGTFRTTRALRPGHPLTADTMLAAGTVMRGDQVRVQVRAGQIGIETAAIAMADAGAGQLIKVRPAGSMDIVTGRLSQAGTVIID